MNKFTKAFTSAIRLRLAEDEKAGLSETLDKYYPQVPISGEITIEQMLRHRSGFVYFTNMSEYAEYHTGEITKDELLERFVGYGTEFSPDEKMQYSNTSLHFRISLDILPINYFGIFSTGSGGGLFILNT